MFVVNLIGSLSILVGILFLMRPGEMGGFGSAVVNPGARVASVLLILAGGGLLMRLELARQIWIGLLALLCLAGGFFILMWTTMAGSAIEGIGIVLMLTIVWLGLPLLGICYLMKPTVREKFY